MPGSKIEELAQDVRDAQIKADDCCTRWYELSRQARLAEQAHDKSNDQLVTAKNTLAHFASYGKMPEPTPNHCVGATVSTGFLPQ